MRKRKSTLLHFLLLMLIAIGVASTELSAQSKVEKSYALRSINPTTYELITPHGEIITFDFYSPQIVRLFSDPNGGIVRDPVANPPAEILVKQPRSKVGVLTSGQNGTNFYIKSEAITINIDSEKQEIEVVNNNNGRKVIESLTFPQFKGPRTEVTLKAHDNEYFYGGGVQNGRFSHRGKVIAIENQNSWTDGGVASPTPFYWSTRGYGMMWHTFAKGRYTFATNDYPGRVVATHDSSYLDIFLMVGDTPMDLLRRFYQLTGHPVLLPKFGFYQGHLNAYNRDYWKESEDGKGILFEDGKKYVESQKDNGGIKESLNGEKGNYQFSARAVIDRYNSHDMPLGWILPNDGYGAGYGQESTLEGNIANLKSFGEYAAKHGVKIGLWTQSDLHPKDGISALLQRDIVREVRDAGVRVLKTDVAWVGAGYSFGLNGVADVAQIMPYYGSDARPFIISLDGWAGTQRYAGIWSGDQTGGEWEYIRFHIPTYIGSGLSGQPNITSDNDGIFGGMQPVVNTRDFQWKTWTPMQLNMDGWGRNPKYPHALGEPATSINRAYLKLKSMIMPYAYSIAHQAVNDKPMIRPMFLEDDWTPYTLGSATRYQFMYGPFFLVAPIYQETNIDKEGNDIRNNIYLPEGVWYDFFTGESYSGGRVINNFDAPLWKTPVFVKAGAIIPMDAPHNNPSQIDRSERRYELYPYGQSSFTEYDDDGETEAYLSGAYATTEIELVGNNGTATFRIHPTQGSYSNMVTERTTIATFNVSKEPRSVRAKVNGKRVALAKANSEAELVRMANAYYYNPAPELNRFSTPGSDAAKVSIKKNPTLTVRLDKRNVSSSDIEIELRGYELNVATTQTKNQGSLAAPLPEVKEEGRQPYSLDLSWDTVNNADYYEILHDSVIYSTIRQGHFTFEDLQPETDYHFALRAVNKDHTTAWQSLTARTLDNPLEWAIRGASGTTTANVQAGFNLNLLFDFVESGDLFHTKYREKAVPFDIIVDLHSTNVLDKMVYLPRPDAGNGTFLEGEVAYSVDGKSWNNAGKFVWKRDAEPKTFEFTEKPTAGYVKITVTKGVGDYGSGRELYIFRVPGSDSFIPGDINNDKKIDENDLISYTNYTGLRRDDADFEYISVGDINKNGLIDAYDISVVATRLEGGVEGLSGLPEIDGVLEAEASATDLKPGDELTITINGKGLRSLNAFSFALPYKESELEFIGVTAIDLRYMNNLTNDRLHTKGDKVLYPTFVNVGDRPSVNGDKELIRIKFRAKKAISNYKPQIDNVILVDKALRSK